MKNSELTLPPTMVAYKKTPVFTHDAVPKGMVKEHSTTKGVWALLHVLSGSLVYRITAKGGEERHVVTPDSPHVIAEEQAHSIVVEDPVSFQLEFFREPKAQLS